MRGTSVSFRAPANLDSAMTMHRAEIRVRGAWRNRRMHAPSSSPPRGRGECCNNTAGRGAHAHYHSHLAADVPHEAQQDALVEGPIKHCRAESIVCAVLGGLKVAAAVPDAQLPRTFLCLHKASGRVHLGAPMQRPCRHACQGLPAWDAPLLNTASRQLRRQSEAPEQTCIGKEGAACSQDRSVL